MQRLTDKRMARPMSLAAILSIFALLALPASARAADGLPAPSVSSAAAAGARLSGDQVVDSLIRRNLERAHALQHSTATRLYHLAYHGFPGDREAGMTVEATYDRPSTKNFRVLEQHGSKLILDRVFKKLLEGEREAADPAMSSRTQLNRDNYEFALVGYEPAARGGQYLLQVTPRNPGKYVYRGKIWVDATDFAVTRIEAEPAQNPSFWTKKSEIHHEYVKVQGFWVPARNESVSYIRLGGRATLTIEYKDYHIVDGRASEALAATSHR